ncbi:MAG: penicillin-binding protein 2 [Actinomycetota bacterium]|nr:penicillin-binding protein 2 [Actinomycetota bacterium]MDH4352607.1 penicillin-binding protein 2 [Actinomycetota bacterium]
MNATIRRSALLVGVLFLALLLNANYIAFVTNDSLRNRAGNSRLIIEEYDHERGSILVGRRAVAKSIETGDRLKYLRTYSDGPLFAPITGYYSVYGATAIERSENSLLAGTDNRLFVDRLTNLFTGREPKGGNVLLTIDADAQRAGYDGLGGQEGAVVALDPQTGAVLAMVSSPSFDPNELAVPDPTAVSKNYDALVADPADPLINRSTTQLYPPGSLFKVVVSAAALSSGQYSPDMVVPGPAVLDLPDTDRVITNYFDSACLGGSLTLTQALAISCNTAFARIGLELGDAALRKQAALFGFNRPLAIPLPVVPSIYPPDLNAPQTAQSAIGQYDVRATPMQMAMVAAGIANQGVVMRPYLVAEEQAPDLSVLSATEPEELSRAVTPAVAAELTDMMVAVVTEGTGANAAIPGVSVAGKTGTAQDGKRPPHVWFMAFAPADAPQVAVAVFVENGGRLGNQATGGAVAAPIARAVMEAVLR